MDEYESTTTLNHHHRILIPRETTLQAFNTVIQVHFEKTLEKKGAVELHKGAMEDFRFFSFFGLFISFFLAQFKFQRRQCRQFWVPIGLLSLAHLIFYFLIENIRSFRLIKYS